jgi:hypothetical protein
MQGLSAQNLADDLYQSQIEPTTTKAGQLKRENFYTAVKRWTKLPASMSRAKKVDGRSRNFLLLSRNLKTAD